MAARGPLIDHATRALIIESAKAHAYDRYLAALLAPPDSRDALLVLAAFEGDVTRIVATVEEPVLAEIRLQWWRDTIAGFSADTRTGNPLADALAELLRTTGVTAESLLDSLDARAKDNEAGSIADDRELFAYLDRTDGAETWRAATVALGSIPDADQCSLIAQAGRANGLARVLRDLPRQVRSGRLLVPLNRFAAAEISDDVAWTLRDRQSIEKIGSEIAGLATPYLAAVERAWRGLPPAMTCALAPTALVGPYLRGLEASGYLAVRPSGTISPLSRVFRIWRAMRLGWF